MSIETIARPLNPVPAPILQFFTYEHLPPYLHAVSKPIHELAHSMAATLPPSAETTVGLRKLLEAKDAFVRAALLPK